MNVALPGSFAQWPSLGERDSKIRESIVIGWVIAYKRGRKNQKATQYWVSLRDG